MTLGVQGALSLFALRCLPEKPQDSLMQSSVRPERNGAGGKDKKICVEGHLGSSEEFLHCDRIASWSNQS